MPLSLSTLLDSFAGEAGRHNPALLGVAQTPLDYQALWRQVKKGVALLQSCGLRPGDRVALVLPDGPEAAAAFLTVASGMVCAPLNPAYRAEQLAFYLTDLAAKAVIVRAGAADEIRDAAARLNLLVFEAVPTRTAGAFELNPVGRATSSGGDPVFAGPDEVALLLHTSGTTARPKLVALTHRNLCLSGQNIARTLALASADRCLNIMPLFHIHGLVGALLASLTAGASVFCGPGFDPQRFFDWMAQCQPTWYTAVPTMHQALLAEAAHRPDAVRGNRLRFIRSSSAALPPGVMRELEAVFQAPAIESYGMTEASHQMASNPLPPRPRKPGSVGLAAGPEVAIMDPAEGRLAPVGQRGEIVIRGASVTAGYVDNPAANAEAFAQGWFRTGDEGRLDEEGYLFITGRLKEMINRGGEKIAPREVDEVLLAHPDVLQAVTFATRHPSLGEDVATAVVARKGQPPPSEAALREWAFARLPAFKTPSRIVVVDGIPLGPTGKLQRIGLEAHLAKALEAPWEAPAEGLEQQIAQWFGQMLRRPTAGRHDNFFWLGGDSIRAIQVIARAGAALGLEIPPTALFRYPTPCLLAAHLTGMLADIELDQLAAELENLDPAEAARLLAPETHRPSIEMS